jgi:hypothetical protein
MSESYLDRERLEELLFASAHDSFSADERDELNAVLLGSADARRFAVQFLSIDAALAESLSTSEAAARYGANHDAVRNVDQAKNVRGLPSRRKAWIAVAAAALIMMGVSVLSWRAGNVDHAQVIEPAGFVQSATRSTAFNSGDTLQPGDLVRFEKGRVVIRFESGVKLAVEGPADLQMVSNNGARMIQGRATVRVPGKIKGFILETPADRIVDLGTAFGVRVGSNGATSISVFEGEIELHGQQHLSGPQHLSAGSSMLVQSNSDSPSEIPYEVSDYLRTWQTSFGLETVEGAMRIAEPHERINPGKIVDGNHLLIFPEQESVQLPAGFVVNATEPGAYHVPKGLKQQVELDSTMMVDSYLIQFNPGQSLHSDSPQQFSGILRMDRPVIGLLFRAAMLDESDLLLGLPKVEFGGVYRRGINAGDEVTLSKDRRTLTVSFNVINGVDQIRVLVASNPSAPN